MITVNRRLVASLIAGNVLGHHTPAIAVAEGQYEQMWVQDALAMYDYAVASARAARLTPFSAPTGVPPSGGVSDSTQSDLSQIVEAIPELLNLLSDLVSPRSTC